MHVHTSRQRTANVETWGCSCTTGHLRVQLVHPLVCSLYPLTIPRHAVGLCHADVGRIMRHSPLGPGLALRSSSNRGAALDALYCTSLLLHAGGWRAQGSLASVRVGLVAPRRLPPLCTRLSADWIVLCKEGPASQDSQPRSVSMAHACRKALCMHLAHHDGVSLMLQTLQASVHMSWEKTSTSCAHTSFLIPHGLPAGADPNAALTHKGLTPLDYVIRSRLAHSSPQPTTGSRECSGVLAVPANMLVWPARDAKTHMRVVLLCANMLIAK